MAKPYPIRAYRTVRIMHIIHLRYRMWRTISHRVYGD